MFITSVFLDHAHLLQYTRTRKYRQNDHFLNMQMLKHSYYFWHR